MSKSCPTCNSVMRPVGAGRCPTCGFDIDLARSLFARPSVGVSLAGARKEGFKVDVETTKWSYTDSITGEVKWQQIADDLAALHARSSTATTGAASLQEYPNLAAIYRGTIAGEFRDWVRVRGELRHYVDSLASSARATTPELTPDLLMLYRKARESDKEAGKILTLHLTLEQHDFYCEIWDRFNAVVATDETASKA